MEKVFNKITQVSIYLLVFLIPLFWLPFSFEAFEFNKQYLLFFLVSLGILAWLAKQILFDKEIKFKRTPLDIPVLVFFGVAILSALMSADTVSSIFGFYGRFSDGLIGMVSLVLFYFLITNNVTVKEEKEGAINIHSLLKTFLWSVFFIVLISYLSIFGLWTQIDNLLPANFSLPPVMMSAVFNPAAGSLEGLSVFLAVVLVFLISQMVSGLENKKGNVLKWLLFLSILLLLVIIDFTAAWILLLVSLLFFVALSLWKRIFREHVNKLLLPIFLVLIAVVFLVINTADFQLPFASQLPKEQVLPQSYSWSIGFKSAIESVKSGFLGSGLGTFHYEFAKFKPIDFNQTLLWQIRFDRSGSHIAEILGTMGFLGILSFLALVGMFLLLSYFLFQTVTSKPKSQKEERNEVSLALWLPLLMAFLALLVGQFVYYQNTVLSFSFWLVLALSVVSWQKPVTEKRFSFKDFPELSLIFSSVFIVILLVFLGIYFFAGRFYLADINYKEGVGIDKMKNLKGAVSFNPYQTQYKLVLARAYLGEVLVESQKAPEEQDQMALANNVHLAITYAKGGGAGRDYIRGAVEISPNRVAAWETLGMIYRDIRGVAAGSTEWGMKAFETAIKLEPANPVLYTELGKLYLATGDTAAARERFDKARTLKPDYIDATLQIALLYESEGNPTEAVKEMENLVQSYPFNIEALFQLGRLYFNVKRTDEAIAQFEKVVLLMPNYSNAYYSLGVAYQLKGQKQDAITAFERVLELNPGNEDVQAKLSQLRAGGE